VAIEWGAYDTGDTNRGARVGIDAIWSAVSNTSTTVTVTWKFYVQNRYTWNNDQQELRYTGDYTGGSSTSYNNPGQEDGEINYVASRTFTYTYGSTSYGASPGSLDVKAKLYNMYNGASPSHTRVVAIPARPWGAPTAPSACAVVRGSDTQNNVTWTRNATTPKPYTALWLERYIYLGPGMVAATGVGSWTRIATLGATVSAYNDAAAIPNRKYTYRVQADNTVATSGYSQSGIIFTTPAAATAPTRTDGVAGSQALTWVNNVGYTEYQTEIWRAVAGVYTLLTTVASGVTSYTDLTASAAQKTKYKFRAKTTSGTVLYSAYSAETTETTGVPTAPTAPTELKPATGTIDPTGPVVFSWKHNPTDGSVQTFFEVQYRHVGSSSWLTSGKTARTLQTWTMPANSVSKGEQVEWQVRTWGYSDTLAGAWSATAIWTTSPLIPPKYPLFLDVDSGRTEADSRVQLITEQTRRVALVSRTTPTANATAVYNILTWTIPATLARTGKRFRFTAEASFVPDTAGMYTDMRIQIGVNAISAGNILAAHYVDHRIVGRNQGATLVAEWTFDPAVAGGENIGTINVVLVGFPGGGGSYAGQAANRPAQLIVDEILTGPSTASGGVSANAATAISAGAGLVGGGDLTSSRVIDVVAADSTLRVNPDSVAVNTQVIATRAYVDNTTGSSGEPELAATNLAPNPSLEGGSATGWVSNDEVGQPLVLDNTSAMTGVYSMRQAAKAVPTAEIASLYLTAADWARFPCVAGQAFTFSLDVKCEVANRAVQFYVAWYNGSTWLAQSELVGVVDTGAAGTTRRAVFTAVPPAGATVASPSVIVRTMDWSPAIPGEKAWLDRLNVGGAEYFDGDTPDSPTDTYNWTGSQYSSTSEHWTKTVGSTASGQWGSAPLDAITYGPDSLRGDPIYVDANGQLRSQPQLIAGIRNVTDSPAMYPVGVSVMGLGQTDAVALGWPASCTVVTVRRAATESVVGQWFYQNHTPQNFPPLVMYRSGNGANTPVWSAWTIVGSPVLASTKTAADLCDTYPTGISTMQLTNSENLAGGWPGGSQYSTIQTIRGGALGSGSGHATQLWSRFSTDVKLQEMLSRSGNVVNGWTPWVTVLAPDTGWINVDYETDWVDYGEPAYKRVQYRKIGTMVKVRGLGRTSIARSAISTAFILPVGFRPTNSEIFDGTSSASYVTGAASTGTAHTHTNGPALPIRMDVTAAGAVTVNATAVMPLAALAYVSFSKILFYTD
jgi:hypothetical protein